MIEVRKNEDVPTYLVRIGNDVYEMDEDANMPNGVSMYYGSIDENDTYVALCRQKEVKQVPYRIVKQIGNILESMKECWVDTCMGKLQKGFE